MSSGSLTVVGIIAAAVGVTAGLLWNEAIQTLIARWFPNQAVSDQSGGSVVGKPSFKAIATKFLFAFGFTILLIVFVMWIGKAINKFPHLRSLKAEF